MTIKIFYCNYISLNPITYYIIVLSFNFLLIFLILFDYFDTIHFFFFNPLELVKPPTLHGTFNIII